jgi:hypothetical protein
MWWLLLACVGAPESVPAPIPEEAAPVVGEAVVEGSSKLSTIRWVKPEPQVLMKTDDGLPIHTRLQRIEDCSPQLVSLSQHDQNIRIAIWPDSPKAPMQGKDCKRDGYPIELEGNVEEATFVYGQQLIVERRVDGVRRLHVFSGPGELLWKASLDALEGAEPVRYTWHDNVLVATGALDSGFRRLMMSTADGTVLLDETADPDDIARMEVAAAKGPKK